MGKALAVLAWRREGLDPEYSHKCRYGRLHTIQETVRDSMARTIWFPRLAETLSSGFN